MKYFLLALAFTGCGPTCDVLKNGEQITVYVQTPPSECPLDACADAQYSCAEPVQCVIVPSLTDSAGRTCYAMVEDNVVVAHFTR